MKFVRERDLEPLVLRRSRVLLANNGHVTAACLSRLGIVFFVLLVPAAAALVT